MRKLSGHFKFCQGFLFLMASWILFSSASLAQTESKSGQNSKGEGQLVNGLREGAWKFYYPNGRLMASETYRNGELNGISTSYFPDGNVSSVENWADDLQQDSSWYFHPNGKIHRKGRYEKGVYQGVWLTFYPGGQIQQSGGYLDGLPSGLYRNWFENGFLQEEGEYSGGKKNGQFVFYFQEKKDRISLIAFYRNDAPAGISVRFNKRGKVLKLEKFDP
ncbi:MAG TPA: toxin-antitoxin system YwqK family antitoxin [Catalimonadaceae bacterium]|nr:toxin-antitoxin system YwqK family antitoxin [Catalimonadaceae bacterium]